MRIVLGSGRNRVVHEFPSGSIISNDKTGAAHTLLQNVCRMLGITK